MPEQAILFDRDLILVVDDDKEFVEAVINELGQEIPDVKFIRAYNGNEGLDKYERSNPRPAVIILDMMMPKRSGFLVLEKVKRTASGNLPLVIMVTVNEGPRHKVYAEMLGTFRYIRKPFHMSVLLEAVQDARGKIA